MILRLTFSLRTIVVMLVVLVFVFVTMKVSVWWKVRLLIMVVLGVCRLVLFVLLIFMVLIRIWVMGVRRLIRLVRCRGVRCRWLTVMGFRCVVLVTLWTRLWDRLCRRRLSLMGRSWLIRVMWLRLWRVSRLIRRLCRWVCRCVLLTG